MKNIFLREVRSYFNSPIAYIVIIAWLLWSGIFFVSDIFLANQATIRGFFDLAPLILLFIIPAVTMRLLAEEEKNGTSEILATLPLNDWEIITGKYLSALVLMGIGLLCTIIYPVSIAFIGPIDWGAVVGSYIGLILLCSGFLAIGIFASSFTKSQIVAFIISIVLCFMLFILGKLLGLVPTNIVAILQYFSIDYHLDPLGRGVIDSRSIIFFLSLIAFFLCWTFYFYRKTKHRLLSNLSIIVLSGIILVANFLSLRLFLRLDISAGSIYSLSKQSVKIIRTLDDPVVVRGYMTSALPFPHNTRTKYTIDLLAEYATKSYGKVKVEIIDPKDSNQKQEAIRSGIYPLQFTEIRESEFGVKEGFMGITFMHGDRKDVMPVVENIVTLEYDITSRIKKLTTKERKQIAFTTGYNETELPDFIKEEIRKRYEVSEINLDSIPVPPLISSIILLGPKSTYSDTAILRIKKFLDSGGTCGFFLDRFNVNLQFFFAFPLETGLEALLNEYGIEMLQGLVMDKQNQVIGLMMERGGFRMQNLVPYPFFPKSLDIDKKNPITSELESVTFPFAAGLNGGTPIARSSKQSWIKEQIQSVNPMDPQAMSHPLPFEKKGPFSLATIVEKPRLIVTGTSKIVEQNYGNPQNLAFFLNAIDWLAQDEELIAIRSKGVQDRPLRQVSIGTKKMIKSVNTIFPSVILLCVGILRWKKRSKRKYEYE